MANDEDVKAFDLVVIGAGSAGFAAAAAAGKAGLRTALIDGADELGGLCILRGCMPTKALLHVAEIAQHVRHAADFGIGATGPDPDFGAVMARKRRLIGEFAQYRREQLESGPFEFIRARARFRDSSALTLSTGQEVRGKYFVVATGSNVAASPLADLDEVGYWTSDDALEAEALPKSLIVLGGGAVAVEFAQFFSRMGVEVTLIQRSERILREFDADAAEALERALKREGIQLVTGTTLKRAWREGKRKAVSFYCRGEERQAVADEILFALGRVPNTGALGLEALGMEMEQARIVTNCEMQTNLPHIYAAGDARGRHEIVHFAIQQAEVAVHNILHPNQMRSIDYRLLTTVIFTDPQLGQVGLCEHEAVERGIPYRAAKHDFADHGKSMIMNATDGFVKLLADPATGEILGGTAIGPFAGELLHEIVAAMYKRMTVQELAVMPHYHPTLAEIWTYPAEELAAALGKAEPVGIPKANSEPPYSR